MNAHSSSQPNIDYLKDTGGMFYIDSKLNNTEYKVIKINYSKYNISTYSDIIDSIDTFYKTFISLYSMGDTLPKIIILIDIGVLKNCIKTNADSIYNINLINLIKYMDDTYNKFIDKCILINYSTMDKGLIMIFKTVFKHIKFVEKIHIYTP